jgi:hypothetical protein
MTLTTAPSPRPWQTWTMMSCSRGCGTPFGSFVSRPALALLPDAGFEQAGARKGNGPGGAAGVGCCRGVC